MARTALTDELWEQLQNVMKQHGCYITKNTRIIMETILWKLRTDAPWRDIPEELVSWKTAYNRFNRWSQNGLWEKFFLAYEKKLIRNGYSSMQAMYGVMHMRVELGLVQTAQLDEAVAAELQKSIYVVMPMDIRSILKSLGVKCTTVKLQTN